MKVAITAVGGGIGQSVIKALKRTRYQTVGIDPRSDAAGLYMADIGCIGKDVKDRGYIETLLRICKKESCKFLFAGLDAELAPISKNIKRFQAIGTTPIISSPRVVEISDDKWKLYEFLKKNKFPHIESARTVEEAIEKKIPLPWVLKPMVGGCRSKGVQIAETINRARDLSFYARDPYIIQEFIEGNEYTCGSVTFYKKVLGTIQMKRTLRDGDTYKAYVESNPIISKFLNELLPTINPFGPCNVQLRIKNNTPYILEINARCSGTTAARALAGFNEPEIICDYLTGNRPNYRIREVAILRYWNECVVEYDHMEEIENEGSIHRCQWRPW